ncbi:MAG: hypothetical protein S4CHLAM7_08460 [Chlamydiae bacterium]|nr:hypothetical protein [Chlamydiota bacterium]
MSSFRDLLEQINDQLEEAPEEFSKESLELSEHSFLLSDQNANEMLMHRNTHFGGKFSFMREYYLEEGVGVQPDIELEEINKLASFEKSIGQDLAPLSLSAQELEKVKTAKKMYDALQKISSISKDPNSIPTLLVDLILTEEEVPKDIIASLAKQEKALSYLVELLNTEEFFDPIYPGYGRTPLHVATCLGQMKSSKAIIPLFESMKQENFIYEETAILALKEIGQEALDFLLKVLNNTPFTLDNEKAAIALMSFDENEDFAKSALKLLQGFQALGNFNLSVQLILGCLGLKDAKDIKAFLELEKNIPVMLAPDFQYASSQLKKRS